MTEQIEPDVAAVLAEFARMLGGSQESAVQRVLAMSPAEIDVVLGAAARRAGTGGEPVVEARRVLLNEAAKAIEATAPAPDDSVTPGADRWGGDETERYGGTARVPLTLPPAGAGPAYQRILDRQTDEDRTALSARRDERNRLLREEELVRAERAANSGIGRGEARESQLRASGIYRALLDRDSESANLADPDSLRGEPLGGARELPVNQDREIQRRAGAMAGAATPDRVSRAAQTVPEARYPLYYSGDEYAPAGWSETRIADLQRQMIDAGLLTSTFRRGYWDGATADAYATLLVQANQTGDTWQDAIPHVQRAFEQGIEIERAQALASFRGAMPAYTPEDPVALRQIVREGIRARTGRNPSAAELATFSAELDQHFRSQYEQEAAIARQELEQAVASAVPDPRDTARASFTGEMPGVGQGISTPPATAPAVDPQARIAASLDAALAGEVDLLDRKSQAADTQQRVSQIAGGLLRKVR